MCFIFVCIFLRRINSFFVEVLIWFSCEGDNQSEIPCTHPLEMYSAITDFYQVIVASHWSILLITASHWLIHPIIDAHWLIHQITASHWLMVLILASTLRRRCSAPSGLQTSCSRSWSTLSSRSTSEPPQMRSWACSPMSPCPSRTSPSASMTSSRYETSH